MFLWQEHGLMEMDYEGGGHISYLAFKIVARGHREKLIDLLC